MIDTKYLRVWKASRELIKALPAARRAPTHTDYVNTIDIQSKHGFEYVTCVTGDWHVDWSEIFEYVVVRGTGILRVGRKEICKDDAHLRACKEPDEYDEVRIQRGDCIHLWPMVPHMVVSLKSMALLSNDVKRALATEVGFNGFRDKQVSEDFFLGHIREKRGEVKKVFT